MRFMMFVLTGQEDSDYQPDTEIVEAMMEYNEQLTKAGAMLAGEGLTPPSKGARLTFRGGDVSVTDGPFAEAKEVVGGFWIIEAKSREEALEWARRCPLDGGTTLEVRQIAEMSDHSEEVQALAGGSEDQPAG